MTSSKILVTNDTHVQLFGVLLTQLQSFEFFINSPLEELKQRSTSLGYEKDMIKTELDLNIETLGIFANISIQSTNRKINKLTMYTVIECLGMSY